MQFSIIALLSLAISGVSAQLEAREAVYNELSGRGLAGEPDLFDELETLTAREISALKDVARRELVTSFNKRDNEGNLFKRACRNLGGACANHDACGGIKNGCICAHGICDDSSYDSGKGRRPRRN